MQCDDVEASENDDRDAARLAELRKQLRAQIRARSHVAPAGAGEVLSPSVSTPAACSRTCCPAPSSFPSAPRRPADGKEQRKRAALASLRSKTEGMSGSYTFGHCESAEVVGVVENLNAKMSRLHSPMKTEDTSNAASETVQPPRASKPTAARAIIAAPIDSGRGTAPVAPAPRVSNIQPVQFLILLLSLSLPVRTHPNALVPYQASRVGTGTGALVVYDKGKMVLHDPHAVVLKNTNRRLSGEEYRHITKDVQRSSQGYWWSTWAYPSGDIFERASLLRVPEFICMGIHGCTVGDCCACLATHDVNELRKRISVRAAELARRSNFSGGHSSALLDVVQSDLLPHWNGDAFGMVSLPVSEYTTVQLCPAAYAFAVGLRGCSCSSSCSPAG